MANLSDLTRKEQVLQYLKDHLGQWVDGPELANEVVGGSEGLKRLRELRDEGWIIQKREHPAKNRDVWQYRLASQDQVDMPPTEAVPPDHLKVSPLKQEPPEPIFERGKNDPFGIWHPVNAVTGEEECEFWVHKQRIVCSVIQEFNGEGWFWGVKIPAYHSRKSNISRKEKRWGGMALTKRVAKDKAELKIHELREMGKEAW